MAHPAAVAASLCLVLTLSTGEAFAQTAAGNPPLTWVTLGTQAGPLPNPERSQAANLLVVKGKPWVVDCGDGAVERLAAAGYTPAQVDAVFLSHLHADHIGGLQGLIGLRWISLEQKGALTVYGPPGTDAVVAGILQSLGPTARMGRGFGVHIPTPEELTRVVIVKDGSDLNLDGVRVRAVRNSHFDEQPGHPADNGSQSLSYRFDYDGYGIGYTGDTGPSDAVARLDRGVDLLVSEVFDVPAMIDFATHNIKPPLAPQAKAGMIQHFEMQHLTPQEAGRIAATAGARRLVFTHIGVPGATAAHAAELVRAAHETFKGEVAVAHDLARF
jgi:ribonuclease BN (tRNA processing enzyme)